MALITGSIDCYAQGVAKEGDKNTCTPKNRIRTKCRLCIPYNSSSTSYRTLDEQKRLDRASAASDHAFVMSGLRFKVFQYIEGLGAGLHQTKRQTSSPRHLAWASRADSPGKSSKATHRLHRCRRLLAQHPPPVACSSCRLKKGDASCDTPSALIAMLCSFSLVLAGQLRQQERADAHTPRRTVLKQSGLAPPGPRRSFGALFVSLFKALGFGRRAFPLSIYSGSCPGTALGLGLPIPSTTSPSVPPHNFLHTAGSPLLSMSFRPIFIGK